MDKDSTALRKSKLFAIRIVRLYQYLCSEKTEFVLSKQLLRSVPASVPILQKVNVPSVKKTFSQKFILH